MRQVFVSGIFLSCCIATGLSLVAAQEPAAKPAGQKFALLVGINKYTELTTLEFAGSDQSALATRLTEAGFPKDQVILLNDQARPGEEPNIKQLPIKRNILRWLTNLTAMTKPNDTLIVAFSGHGIEIDGKRYLCPADADPEDPLGTMVDIELLNAKLKTSDAKLKLLILDCCRDDPRPPGRRSNGKEVKFDYGLPPDGVVAINSCSRGLIAHEDKKLGHGVFMHYFLQGLDGKAAGDDGTVTLGGLFEYASRETDKYTAHSFGSIQKPSMVPDTAQQVALIRVGDRARPGTGGGIITNSLGMKLALIPAGEFVMGSPESETGRDEDDQAHLVRITKPFYLGVYEVTQGEYGQVMSTNPSSFVGDGRIKEIEQEQARIRGNMFRLDRTTDLYARYVKKLSDLEVQSKEARKQYNKRMAATTGGDRGRERQELDTRRFPVENVSWEDAVEFCRRLSAKEGREYRLPTEAEWEYACRAKTTTAFHFGGALDGSQANCQGSNPYGVSAKGPDLGRTTEAGSYSPNDFGLYDMHGNVYEWCSDWYGADFYGASPAADPRGPTSGSDRVIRGGAWNSLAVSCRSASRARSYPSLRYHALGFRVFLAP